MRAAKFLPVETADSFPTDSYTPLNLPFQPRVLIADDNEQVARNLQSLLESDLGLLVNRARDGKQALEALERDYYSLCLTDLKMPHVEGMDLIHQIERRSIPVTVIVMTGYASIDVAVEAIRSGAYDFLAKPIDLERLKQTIGRALRERTPRDSRIYLGGREGIWTPYPRILSQNPHMLSILTLVNDLGQTTANALIEGETGTGKEEIARAIHQASSALRPGPLVVLNCAALPETLLESELFGHEKGAFTSALAQRKGRFEQANHGTLFLDEVGEIPMSMQVKLLRVLQERCFERVGGTEPIEVDVRIIAASNRSLLRLMKKGKFREDLYYRLNVIRIELPPLRERLDDLPLLVNHFCEKFAQPGAAVKALASEAMDVLRNHSWPGNIRELANVIERACITCPGKIIGVEHLPPELTHQSRSSSRLAIDLSCPLPKLLARITRHVERRYICKALARADGHVGGCAKICGLSRRSITLKLARYKINRSQIERKKAEPARRAKGNLSRRTSVPACPAGEGQAVTLVLRLSAAGARIEARQTEAVNRAIAPHQCSGMAIATGVPLSQRRTVRGRSPVIHWGALFWKRACAVSERVCSISALASPRAPGFTRTPRADYFLPILRFSRKLF
jgi:DNA-binding NtrC family response regulator